MDRGESSDLYGEKEYRPHHIHDLRQRRLTDDPDTIAFRVIATRFLMSRPFLGVQNGLKQWRNKLSKSDIISLKMHLRKSAKVKLPMCDATG